MAVKTYLYGPSPLECLDLLQSLPCAELCLDLLNGIGVPCGLMKGVLHSEAEPNVAARETSEPEEPKLILAMAPPTAFPPCPPPPPPLGNRCRGSALPELCLDLSTGGTGVLRGLMNGLAFGLCGREFWRGLIGWKLKCRLRVPERQWKQGNYYWNELLIKFGIFQESVQNRSCRANKLKQHFVCVCEQ